MAGNPTLAVAMFALVIVALWVMFTTIGAIIFDYKNREPGWGAVLGATLGLLGLIIAACFSKREV